VLRCRLLLSDLCDPLDLCVRVCGGGGRADTSLMYRRRYALWASSTRHTVAHAWGRPRATDRGFREAGGSGANALSTSCLKNIRPYFETPSPNMNPSFPQRIHPLIDTHRPETFRQCALTPGSVNGGKLGRKARLPEPDSHLVHHRGYGDQLRTWSQRLLEGVRRPKSGRRLWSPGGK